MRSFLILVGSFLLVYFATPWLMYVLLRRVHFSNPDRTQNGLLILAGIGVCSSLRKRFGDRLPPIWVQRTNQAVEIHQLTDRWRQPVFTSPE